jgi:hypothetical protein
VDFCQLSVAQTIVKQQDLTLAALSLYGPYQILVALTPSLDIVGVIFSTLYGFVAPGIDGCAP